MVLGDIAVVGAVVVGEGRTVLAAIALKVAAVMVMIGWAVQG